MQPTTSKKVLGLIALVLAVLALVAAISALALNKSLPYRIGPEQYAQYLWAGRFACISAVIAVIALIIGIASRQWLPIGFALLSPIFLVSIGGVHSGPNPRTWCFNNLRQIDSAKEQLAQKNQLTNGVVVTLEQILPYIEARSGGIECAEHGQYTINPIGAEPRCSSHGSMSEMITGKP